MKIVNYKRFVTALAILISFFVLIFLISVLASDNVQETDKDYRVYFVSPGDTLWDIAVYNKGDIDVRTYLYYLKKINNLKSSDILPGFKLILP